MDTLQITRGQINELTSRDAAPAVSIYVPTPRMGTDVLQSRIRLKNLLTEAENHLVARGMRRTLAKDFLLHASELVDATEFWNERLDSVAIFVSKNRFQAFHLPFATPEHLEVGSHFYVRPLLRVLSLCPIYYVLALEKNHVRLVRCSQRGADSVNVPHMPESLDAFLSTDHADKQYQFYSAGRGGRAGSLIGYGAGDRSVDERERIRRFSTAIDRAIIEHIAPALDPVVIVGTQEMQDAYRSVSKLPNLVPKGITC